MTYGYQMRPFTQDEVDAAEARLEVWHLSHQFFPEPHSM
jgi:hypothetical protein